MKYPKLKCEEKLNSKVCSAVQKKMKDMRTDGATFSEIATKFKVSHRTAWKHTANPELVEKSRIKRNKATADRNSRLYQNDMSFCEKSKQSSKEFIEYRITHDKDYQKYDKECRKEYRNRPEVKMRKKEYDKEYRKEYYLQYKK